MRKGVFDAILWWLHKVGRYVLSYWFLIIVFSCLAVYLIFPGPLDPLSSAFWSPGIGEHVRVSYTVSGATTYPGNVSLTITVTDNDIVAHDYAILALVGSGSAWWGPGFYTDNLAPATGVQNISNPWYSQAFITTGSLNPGQSFQVTRKIEIANDYRVKDALVIVYDKHDVSNELARLMKLDVIHV